ncbi:5-methylcytosine-specific restriction protein B [Bradyrhizobium sp. USDA 4449]
MSSSERQQQFEQAVRAVPGIRPDARIASNFGFSNSARVLEGGLFACTNNLQTYSENLSAGTITALQQMVFLCVLTFPPQDEVYFAISVGGESSKLNDGLLKLFREGQARNSALVAASKKPGSISNNVKFYITDHGNLFFHNYDFKESLSEAKQKGDLDPDCQAKIDAIHFAIWPPAASARRSLLARQFVGYLGNLVGREKVHEIRVWDEAGAVSPGMRRMPSTIPIEEIEKAVEALGGYYRGGEVPRIHAALNFLQHKHFIILSGLSGTGKTQLALKYARAVHQVGVKEPDPFLFVCAVRPEWTDPTGLTGYYDVLSNRYVVPPFLEAVLLATAHRDSPVFVILDEMNLARVEYYLSDILSAIETGEALQLHSSGVPLEGSTGTSVPAELPVPQNIYLIGTINIDETTNPVSDKVLDRAIVIDMSTVDVPGFIANLRVREPTLVDACNACEANLRTAHDIMAAHGLAFGYRVVEEVIRYQAFTANHLKQNATAVLDDLMVQKVLVKLRGADRQRSLLTGLVKASASLPRSQAFLNRLLADLDEFGSFQASR